tara:strand:+ start:1337 stop:1921 length:585 start_codon:yes stop_codon:yes gene_type:complete
MAPKTPLPFSIGGGGSKESTKTESERQLEREIETSKRPTRQFMQAFDTLAYMGNMPAGFGFGTLSPDSRFNQALTGLAMAGEPTPLEQRRLAQMGGSFMSPYGMDMDYTTAGLADALRTGQAGMPPGMGIGDVPIVVTQAEYDALPPGSEYEGEDGQIYKKPGGEIDSIDEQPLTQPGIPNLDFLENLVGGTYG